jgi:hypothetical protein
MALRTRYGVRYIAQSFIIHILRSCSVMRNKRNSPQKTQKDKNTKKGFCVFCPFAFFVVNLASLIIGKDNADFGHSDIRQIWLTLFFTCD